MRNQLFSLFVAYSYSSSASSTDSVTNPTHLDPQPSVLAAEMALLVLDHQLPIPAHVRVRKLPVILPAPGPADLPRVLVRAADRALGRARLSAGGRGGWRDSRRRGRLLLGLLVHFLHLVNQNSPVRPVLQGENGIRVASVIGMLWWLVRRRQRLRVQARVRAVMERRRKTLGRERRLGER